METVAKSKSKPIVSSKSEETAKRPSGRQTDPLLSSPRSRRRQLADENIDVTTYLLHRMLGAPAQLPDDRTTLVSAGKKPGKDADDKHSEAGTYTIDDEEDEAVKQSIQQARDRIDDVFGIADGMEHKADTASSHLVRPVIEAKHTQQGQSEPSAVKADDDDDDAFVGVDEDDVHQQHYVRILLTEFSFSLLWDYAIMKWIPTFTKICWKVIFKRHSCISDTCQTAVRHTCLLSSFSQNHGSECVNIVYSYSDFDDWCKQK